MADDLRADLIRHFLAEAEAATRRREWGEVLELAEDILVLDHDNSDARLLRTLAERHVEVSQPDRGRRHETVVFADLVGSTALANRFDPEFVQRLTLAYERACSPVLAALGGHVHRFVGDGILASFGYPTSHEDDAQRAVQAALDLAETVAATSASYSHLGIELQVRVGVASGVLVHADRGSGSWTQPGDLFGPAVNLAARIHEIAEPGQVCISSDTAALVAGFFELTSLGPHPLKGFDAPIEIHRVLGRTRATGWFDRPGRVASPFLGRAEELGRLRGLWDALGSAGGPDGNVVLITGDPGVGKSRILRELLDTTADGGRSVVELRCSAYRATSPLYPVRSAIERYAGFEPDDDDEIRLAKLGVVLEAGGLVVDEALPYLALLLELDAGERAPRPESSPAQVRAVTLRELQRWLTALASASPTMLIVEDIHWADPTTRDLLLQVVTAPPPGLLVLMTARSAPAWLEGVTLGTVALGPLTRDETRALVRAVAGTEVPPQVVDEIARRSDGIPLFVEQLADDRAGSDDDDSQREPIPASLAELLQARLDGAGSSKRVAQIAATVGREFEPAVVEAVVDRLQEEGKLDSLDRPVREHLDRLLESHLIEPDEDQPGHFRFHHALLGQAAYESQLRRERPERHEALARVLVEAGVAGRPADPAVLAYHFDEAGLVVEAVGQYLAAAARGQDIGAYAEVLAHLDRAADLLGTLGEAERPPFELAVRLNRGLASTAVGGYAAPQAVEDFERAFDLCQRLREVPEMGLGMHKALHGLWTFYCATGDLGMAGTISVALDQQLEQSSFPGGRPSYHACCGVEHFFAGTLPGAHEHLARCVELFATDDVDYAEWPLPHDPLAAALAFVGPLRLIAGDEEGALAATAAGLARCADLGFPMGPVSTAFVRLYEAWMHRLRGAVDDAAFAAGEVARIGERHGFFDWMIVGRIHLAAAAAAREPSRAALDEMGAAIDTWRAAGGQVLVPSLIIEQGWGYLALGDLDRAQDCLDDAAEIIGRGQQLSLAEAHRLRAELAALRSGPDDPLVAAELDAGLRFAHDQGAALFVLRCAASYDRWLGSGQMPAELRSFADAATAAFGPDSRLPELVRERAYVL